MHYLRAITTGVVLLACVSCAGLINPGAESFVSVRGKVANALADATCGLQLYTEKGKASGELTVAPEFQRSLVIAPRVQKYYVELSCSGHPGKFTSKLYELGGGTRTLDLGTIVTSDQ